MPQHRAEVVVDFNIGKVNLPPGMIDIPADIKLDEGPEGGGSAGWLAALQGIIGPKWATRIKLLASRIYPVVQAIRSLRAEVSWLLIPLAALVTTLYAVGAVSIQCWNAIVKLGQVVGRVLVASLKMAVEWGSKLGSTIWNLVLASLRGIVRYAKQAADALVDLAERGIKSAIGLFFELEQQAASTAAVMGKTGEEAQKTRIQLMDMSTDMASRSRYGARDLITSMQDVAKAGYESTSALWEVTNAGRILAEATLEPLDMTIELLIKTLNQYSMGADESMRVTNALAAAANKSLASVYSLGEALKYAGPSAHMFGISLEETLAALMAMMQQGASGSMAGTQLTTLFNSLLKQTDKAQAAFAEYGLNLAEVSPTKMGIIEIVRWFEDLAKRIGDDEMKELIGRAFELRSIRGFNALLNIGSMELEKMMKSITGTNDALHMQAEQMLTLQGAWFKFQHVLENIGTKVMRGGAAEAMRGFVEWFGALADWADDVGIFAFIGGTLQFVLTEVTRGLAQLAQLAAGIIRPMARLLNIMLKDLAIAFQYSIPFIKVLLSVLPAVTAQIASGLLPAILQLARQALPYLTRLTINIVQLGISILTVLVQGAQRLLSQGGGALTDLLVNWYTAILDLVKGIPELVPLFSELLQMLVAMPGRVVGFVRDTLPVVVWAVWQIHAGITAIVLQIQTAVTEWLPAFSEWLSRAWGVARVALIWVMDTFNAWFGIMAGFADLLPMIGSLLWALSMPLVALVGLGSTLLAIFGMIAYAIEKVYAGMAAGARALGMEKAAQYFEMLSQGWRGIERVADNSARIAANLMKAWWAAPQALIPTSEVLGEAAAQGRQATAAAGKWLEENERPFEDTWRTAKGRWGMRGEEVGYQRPAAQTTVDVQLKVPPDWEALRIAFEAFAREQQAQQQQARRTGGPGFGFGGSSGGAKRYGGAS